MQLNLFLSDGNLCANSLSGRILRPMIEPGSALLISGLLALVVALLFWPVRGYLWRWQRLRRLTTRIYLEDAVKHLYNCQYRGQTPSVESLSGALQISGSRAAELLIQLQTVGLSTSTEGRLSLTPLGRENALRILRFASRSARSFDSFDRAA